MFSQGDRCPATSSFPTCHALLVTHKGGVGGLQVGGWWLLGGQQGLCCLRDCAAVGSHSASVPLRSAII